MITDDDTETIDADQSGRDRDQHRELPDRRAATPSPPCLCDEVAFWRRTRPAPIPTSKSCARCARPGVDTRRDAADRIVALRQAGRALRRLSPALRQGRRARPGVEGRHGAMNPSIDPAIIEEAYDSDPEAARAEYGAEFRDDLADYVTREAIDAVTCWGAPNCRRARHRLQRLLRPVGRHQRRHDAGDRPPPPADACACSTRCWRSGRRSIRRVAVAAMRRAAPAVWRHDASPATLCRRMAAGAVRRARDRVRAERSAEERLSMAISCRC